MRTRTALIAAVVWAAAFGPAPASAATPTCFGKKATIEGTAGDDRLTGTGRDDVIVGLRGDDHILGGGGRDRICAGPGDDTVGGERGRDSISGHAGKDRLYGGPAADRLSAGGGIANDLLGGGGDDVLQGGPGFERLFGQEDDDILRGGEGVVDRAVYVFSDRRVVVDLAAGEARGEGRDAIRDIEDVEGSRHNDILYGDRNPNWFFPRAGADRIDGRGSTGDLVSLDAAKRAVVASTEGATGQGADEFARVEGLQGSRDFGDTLTGNGRPNVLLGIGGPDELFGLDDDDWLDGGAGSDAGDGGDHVFEDRCIEVEEPVNCEVLGVSASFALRDVPGVRAARLGSAVPRAPRLR